MKKIIWTKSDAKRAKAMGFFLNFHRRIVRYDDASPFKTDDEAVEWVVRIHREGFQLSYDKCPAGKSYLFWGTIDKALLLCAGGGR